MPRWSGRTSISFRAAPRYAYGDDGVGSDSDEEGPSDESGVKSTQEGRHRDGHAALHLAHYRGHDREAPPGLASRSPTSMSCSTRSITRWRMRSSSSPPRPALPRPARLTNVLFFDLNHCNTSHVQPSQVSFEGQHVVVLDHTSATTAA